MPWKHWLGGAVAVTALAISFDSGSLQSAETKPNDRQQQAETVASGRELFTRQWLPNDPRTPHGDGLGPVFNETSCVACHNQGGPGGAGASSQNVDIVSIAIMPGQVPHFPQPSATDNVIRSLLGLSATPQPKGEAERRAKMIKQLEGELKQIHPGFLTSQSLVVHKYSVNENYGTWRQSILPPNQQAMFFPTPTAIQVQEAQAVEAVPVEALELPAETFTIPEGGQLEAPADFSQFAQMSGDTLRQQFIQSVNSRIPSRQVSFRGRFTLSASQRNTTSLFGVGQLDSIPDEVLIAQAAKRFEEYPEISGRACRLKGDKIGRFGWKSQTATLEDFALTACAVEIGLNVPGHTQAGLASDSEYRAPGLDMTKAECDALVAFLRDIPAPVRELPAEPAVADFLKEGHQLFAKVGCAHCHTENLGEVAGVYSDLLLHEMGDLLQDEGDYGVFVPESPGSDQEPIIEQMVKNSDIPQVATPAVSQKAAKAETIGARQNEWRTPPLWGVRDSAPYLHDGRAQSLEEAIALHDGEARRSSRLFFSLTPAERLKLVMFLKSLTAPDQVAVR